MEKSEFSIKPKQVWWPFAFCLVFRQCLQSFWATKGECEWVKKAWWGELSSLAHGTDLLEWEVSHFGQNVKMREARGMHLVWPFLASTWGVQFVPSMCKWTLKWFNQNWTKTWKLPWPSIHQKSADFQLRPFQIGSCIFQISLSQLKFIWWASQWSLIHQKWWRNERDVDIRIPGQVKPTCPRLRALACPCAFKNPVLPPNFLKPQLPQF